MRTQKMKAKVALVGDGAVGKTSLIRRFVLDEFDDKYLHTIGTKVMKIRLTIPHGPDTEVDVDLSIFDIMGQKGFRDMVRETFFHDAQGLIGVCDVTNRSSLDSLHDWIASALEVAGDVPVYILVNKKDLMNRAQFGDGSVQKAAEPWDAPVIFTSAKTGESVDDAFNALGVEIVNNAFRKLRERSAAADLENRILESLAIRGSQGLSKANLFERLPGVGYDDLKRALDRLETRALVQIAWKGAADFSVLITEKGFSSVRNRVPQDEQAAPS